MKNMGKWSALENLNSKKLAVFVWLVEKDANKKFIVTILLKKTLGFKHMTIHQAGMLTDLCFADIICLNAKLANFCGHISFLIGVQILTKFFKVHIALITVAIWRKMYPDVNCSTTNSLLLTLFKKKPHDLWSSNDIQRINGDVHKKNLF